MTFPPANGGAGPVTLNLSAPEAGTLLDQLGAPVLWTQDLGPARLSARAEPDPARQGARRLSASADLAGLHGEFRGGLAEDFSLDGEADLSGDAGAILALYSLGSDPSPLRLVARVGWRDGALALHDLAGDWAGARVEGDMSADATGLKGALHCDRLWAGALVALVLGPPQPARAGVFWSSLSFAPVLLDPPPAQLSVTTDDLEPFGGKARFDLGLRPGALSVARAQAAVLGGAARGGFDLRRDGRQVSVSGDVEASDLALDNPAFSARLDGRLKFAGSGVSASALAASLAGEGAVRLRDLVIRQAAAAAADEALRASEASDAPFDAKAVAKRLDAAFARAPLRRAEAGFAVRLAGGQLALTPADEGGQGVDAGFDLRDANFVAGFFRHGATFARRLDGARAAGVGGLVRAVAVAGAKGGRLSLRRRGGDAGSGARTGSNREAEKGRPGKAARPFGATGRPLKPSGFFPVKLQQAHAQGRGEIGLAARGVDFRDQSRDADLALLRPFAQGVPESGFERDACAVAGDDQGMFADSAGRLHVSSPGASPSRWPSSRRFARDWLFSAKVRSALVAPKRARFSCAFSSFLTRARDLRARRRLTISPKAQVFLRKASIEITFNSPSSGRGRRGWFVVRRPSGLVVFGFVVPGLAGLGARRFGGRSLARNHGRLRSGAARSGLYGFRRGAGQVGDGAGRGFLERVRLLAETSSSLSSSETSNFRPNCTEGS